jgi:putative oligomerization/nucleic acid binding protein
VLALFGTEVLRVQTAQEFPEARSGGATHAIRTRMAGMRRPSSPPSSASTADQLKDLAKLRDDGALTAEEYDAAKSQLLNGG